MTTIPASLSLLALIAVVPTATAAETGGVGQPPAVNKPVERTTTPPATGAQYVRQPIVKEPAAASLELDQVQAELNKLKTEIEALNRKRDSVGTLGQAQALQLQQAMAHKAKLEERIAALQRQQSETQQTLIDNLK